MSETLSTRVHILTTHMEGTGVSRECFSMYKRTGRGHDDWGVTLATPFNSGHPELEQLSSTNVVRGRGILMDSTSYTAKCRVWQLMILKAFLRTGGQGEVMTTVSHRQSRLSPLDYHQPLTTNAMLSEGWFSIRRCRGWQRCGQLSQSFLHTRGEGAGRGHWESRLPLVLTQVTLTQIKKQWRTKSDIVKSKKIWKIIGHQAFPSSHVLLEPF